MQRSLAVSGSVGPADNTRRKVESHGVMVCVFLPYYADSSFHAICCSSVQCPSSSFCVQFVCKHWFVNVTCCMRHLADDRLERVILSVCFPRFRVCRAEWNQFLLDHLLRDANVEMCRSAEPTTDLFPEM